MQLCAAIRRLRQKKDRKILQLFDFTVIPCLGDGWTKRACEVVEAVAGKFGFQEERPGTTRQSRVRNA